MKKNEEEKNEGKKKWKKRRKKERKNIAESTWPNLPFLWKSVLCLCMQLIAFLRIVGAL